MFNVHITLYKTEHRVASGGGEWERWNDFNLKKRWKSEQAWATNSATSSSSLGIFGLTIMNLLHIFRTQQSSACAFALAELHTRSACHSVWTFAHFSVHFSFSRKLAHRQISAAAAWRVISRFGFSFLSTGLPPLCWDCLVVCENVHKNTI